MFGAAKNLPARFEAVPIDQVDDDDSQAMFRWFTKLPAYEADMVGTRMLAGDVTDLPTFVAQHPQ